ncbi:alpha/beta fold hydrolase [Sinomonas sp. ASV322]|uniref:alpha/beta fold hydrolase n=1 Tax=Sinomonas sp. ASV322 TaxID=3041920 RepID=UPI0027DE5523|nr:alpha/beta fold hydrolase [Sinomonas sp. ASV322]MDQ4504582.1 alpha/beta fold hydrolase [Sinomonas sp. ASV322]
MSTHIISTQAGPLEIAIDGRGAPAVLMHSLFVDSRSWDRIRARLAEDRRLIIITAPGHGRSGDPGRRYSIGDVADAAVSVLDSLGITDPVDWVGNALGGHAGILFAASHPDRCRSLVALGAPVHRPSAWQRLQEWAIGPARAVFGMNSWVGGTITDVLCDVSGDG